MQFAQPDTVCCAKSACHFHNIWHLIDCIFIGYCSILMDDAHNSIKEHGNPAAPKMFAKRNEKPAPESQEDLPIPAKTDVYILR
ncbi:MAG: hypothetical protein ABIG67_10425, partial [Pseudomonadota bacterium]